MKLSLLKTLLPNRSILLPILGGPFRSARIYLNPHNSLRKVFGVYEYQLNEYLEKVLTSINTVIDVGAADGYFTLGCASAIKRNYDDGYIISFEPDLSRHSALQSASKLSRYSGINFEVFDLFVGEISNGTFITLDQIYQERSLLKNKTLLIKVDVEGGEVNVLKGATSLISKPHQWIVEVHGDHLLKPVLDIFIQAERNVEVISPKPHWLLGSECRSIKTSWVITQS